MGLTDIKRISIRDYLGTRGIKPQSERGGRAMYLSPLRREETASFSVNHDANVWYDHGIGEGGSIIDLVSRMEGCTVGEAIRRLEYDVPGALSFSFHGNTPVPSRSTEPERPRIEIVSVGELKHPALVEYLRERGIDLAAARKYCNEVRYSTGGREYFAIGFSNDAGGWELRNRSFKGSSTPKNITTIRNGSDTVMVFEGFIDFLSYLSLKANPSPTIDTAVLNSVANLRRAIPFLESHRTIHAFLDNRCQAERNQACLNCRSAKEVTRLRERRGRTKSVCRDARIVTRFGGSRSVGILPHPQRPERLLARESTLDKQGRASQLRRHIEAANTNDNQTHRR